MALGVSSHPPYATAAISDFAALRVRDRAHSTDPVVAYVALPWDRHRHNPSHPESPKRKVYDMKIVVIGGTGLIGAHVVQKLTLASHEAIPAARYTGVDLITGDGLEQVLTGAEVVINLANSPTFDEASLDFFRISMTNLLAAGARAGVGHQVVLSIVGVDRVPQVDYFRAKNVQEGLLRRGPTPYSIVRATQFFEFMDTVISWASDDSAVRLPPTRIQPVAAADVVDAVVEVSLGPPLMSIRNVAGPGRLPPRRARPGHPERTGRRPERHYR
jgi:uncharacterized protein YbjT (DUF2867 family)